MQMAKGDWQSVKFTCSTEKCWSTINKDSMSLSSDHLFHQYDESFCAQLMDWYEIYVNKSKTIFI